MNDSIHSPERETQFPATRGRTMIEDVSFVVIARNEEFGVDRCLRALVSMPLRNCEVLAVDSESTDSTLDVMRRYANESPIISVLRCTGEVNAAVARNVGLERARKRHICFCDGDTEWEEAFLVEALRILNAGEAVAVTGSLAERVYCRSYERVLASRLRKYYPAPTPVYYCGGNFIVRRDVAVAAGPWDERLVRAQDGDYTLRVSRQGRIIALPEIIGTHHTLEFAERTWGNLKKGYPAFDGIVLRRNADRPAVLRRLLLTKYRGFLWGYALFLLAALATLVGMLAPAAAIWLAVLPGALILADVAWGRARGERLSRRLLTHYAYPAVAFLGLLLGGKPLQLTNRVEHLCGPEGDRAVLPPPENRPPSPVCGSPPTGPSIRARVEKPSFSRQRSCTPDVTASRPGAIQILITTNPLNHAGGVVNFHRLLFAHFQSQRYELLHHAVGSRMEHYYAPIKKRILYPFLYLHDLACLARRLWESPHIQVVQVNPSLIPVPLLRDGVVILLAKLMRRRVVVFFRGWKEHVLDRLRRRRPARWLFRQVYGRADLAIVLARRFRHELAELAMPRCGIEVATTMYDSAAVLPATDRCGQCPRFLFLGRVSESKGVGELLEAAKILQAQGRAFELYLAGHGDRPGKLETYQELARAGGLTERVQFLGALSGNDKSQAYANADVFVLPSWTEGCPTSVLEALGSGLFVLSTDVGALPEIIEDGENGRFVRPRDPADLAEKMAWACQQVEDLRRRRDRIRDESVRRFEARTVVTRFSQLYDQVLASPHGK